MRANNCGTFKANNNSQDSQKQPTQKDRSLPTQLSTGKQNQERSKTTRSNSGCRTARRSHVYLRIAGRTTWSSRPCRRLWGARWSWLVSEFWFCGWGDCGRLCRRLRPMLRALCSRSGRWKWRPEWLPEPWMRRRWGWRKAERWQDDETSWFDLIFLGGSVASSIWIRNKMTKIEVGTLQLAILLNYLLL